jgi:hypothetical protein
VGSVELLDGKIVERLVGDDVSTEGIVGLYEGATTDTDSVGMADGNIAGKFVGKFIDGN